VFGQQRREQLFFTGRDKGRFPVKGIHDHAGRGLGIFHIARAFAHQAGEFRIDGPAAAARKVCVTGGAFNIFGATEAKRRTGSNHRHREQALRIVHDHTPDYRAAQGMAHHMHLWQLQIIQQGQQIIGPIARAACRINFFVPICTAITAQVGREGAITGRQSQHDLFPIGGRRGVTVNEQDRNTRLWPTEQHASREARGGHGLRSDTGECRYCHGPQSFKKLTMA